MNKLEEIISYGKLLHSRNLVIGSGGNISVRQKQGFFIKKKDVNMSRAGKDDYIFVDLTDIEGSKDIVSTETPLHIGCYESDKSIGAVIHVHSPYMVAVAEKVSILKSPSYECDCILGDEIPVLRYVQPGSVELAAEVKILMKNGAKALLLKKHGAVAVGKDLEQAFLRVLALERAAQVELLR